MKKFLVTLILGLILFAEISYAKREQFKRGKIYEGKINWSHKIIMDLPPGQWEVMEVWGWSVSNVFAKGVALVQIENGKLKNLIEITEVDGGGKWISIVAQWVESNVFFDKYDGCYERSEYYLVKFFKKGMSYNCFRVRHVDLNKELHYPDNPDGRHKTSTAQIRRWISKNNIQTPSIMLGSMHLFFSPSVKDTLTIIDYYIDPELNGAPKNKFITEETSEYHRSNINQYPDKKKYMENWVKIAAQRHKIFEELVRAKEHHKLDLSEYGVGEVLKETQTTVSSSGLTEEIKELHKLYEEGVITKEEFEKGKKKILSQ